MPLNFESVYSANRTKGNGADKAKEDLITALTRKNDAEKQTYDRSFDERKQAFIEKLGQAGLVPGGAASQVLPGVGLPTGQDFSPAVVNVLKPEAEAKPMSAYQEESLSLRKRMIGNQEKKATQPEAATDDARSRVSENLKTLKGYYNELSNAGAAVDTKKSGMDNMRARVGASGPGQLTGEVFGTANQSTRNKIQQIQPLLIQDIRQASKMGAKGLDSEKELEFYLKAATNPRLDIQANLSAIGVLDKAYGLGLGIEDQQPQAQQATPAVSTSDSFIAEMEKKGFKFKGVK